MWIAVYEWIENQAVHHCVRDTVLLTKDIQNQNVQTNYEYFATVSLRFQ